MKFVCILLLLALPLFAGFNHDWQTITTLNEINDLAAGQNTVWVATTGGLYALDQQSNEIRTYTNVDGLTSISLNTLALDSYGHLITGGDRGILEIYDITADTWKQLYTLAGNAIRDIEFQNDTLWVAAGKGLAVFIRDGMDYHFKDYFLNFNVLPDQSFDAALFAGRIWLATDVGLLSAPANLNRYTINDPAIWKVFKSSNGLPASYIHDLQVIGDELWVGTSQGIARIDAGLNIRIIDNWYRNDSNKFISAEHIKSSGPDVFVSNYRSYYKIDESGSISWQATYTSEVNTLGTDTQNSLLIGLNGGGLVDGSTEEPLLLDGPSSNVFRYVLKDATGQIWGLSGRPRSYRGLGFYLYDNKRWNNIKFVGSGWASLSNNVLVYEDRFQNIWMGTWGGGLFCVRPDGELIFFHNYDTPGQMVIKSVDGQEIINVTDNTVYSGFFTGVVKAPTYEVISAVREDFQGNLWVANYWAANGNLLARVPYDDNGFINLNPDNWVHFGAADGIIADEGGVIAIDFDSFSSRVYIGTQANGVYVLDYNNTPADKSDDEIEHLQINDNLYSNSINTLATDQDGILWIGTASGLNSYDGINVYKHVGDEQGKSGPLSNQINHIFVDKHGNKWFATSGGLSILRADRSPWDPNGWQGFTVDNSGLVDNEVHGVYVDAQSSEALIGTENGLSIYRGTFAEIQDNFKKTKGGPNPFIVSSEAGYFTLNNLKKNSVVKILTLSGKLVRELKPGLRLSNGQLSVDGSRAFWDGRDLKGNKVNSGVYVYLAFTEDGASTAGKIAVIRN